MTIHIIVADKFISDKELKKGWTKQANDPERWIDSAVDLHNSFIVLYPLYIKHRKEGVGITFLNPALLLLGFCIENLLKACYLKRGEKISTDGKLLLPNIFKRHNLVNIAYFLGLNLTKEEKEVLRLLTLFITAVGRYPVGLNWEMTRIFPRNGKKPASIYWRDDQQDIAEGLIAKLRS